MGSVVDAAQRVAESLSGTCCDTIETTLAKLELPAGLEDDAAFLSELDSLVFECTCCGWWCEQSECHEDENDQWICDDCFNDR